MAPLGPTRFVCAHIPSKPVTLSRPLAALRACLPRRLRPKIARWSSCDCSTIPSATSAQQRLPRPSSGTNGSPNCKCETARCARRVSSNPPSVPMLSHSRSISRVEIGRRSRCSLALPLPLTRACVWTRALRRNARASVRRCCGAGLQKRRPSLSTSLLLALLTFIPSASPVPTDWHRWRWCIGGRVESAREEA